jgi:GAF domain-containing protein
MTVQSVQEPDPQTSLRSAQRETETLYAVIRTVSSSLDLDRVLSGIVEIATEATGCHACFIYILEGRRLMLRAASPRYAPFVGRLALGVDEGLAGWVARTKSPEFIRENAMADPRTKYVPELEEERFQSLVAVPLLAKSGEVIGVTALHTTAPREFDHDVLNFLIQTASLAAGAIENAQLYEETRRRVQALTTLNQLSQRLAAVSVREDLLETVTRGTRELLGAATCQIYRLDGHADQLVLARADPEHAPAPSSRPGGTGLVLDLMRRANGHGRDGRGRVARTLWPEVDDDALLVAPLVVGEEQLGIICCLAHDRQFADEDAELLGAVANQTAVGLKKTELIERLTAENLVRDMFEALASGSIEAATAKADEAGCDLRQPHLIVHAERTPHDSAGGAFWSDLAGRLDEELRRLGARSFLDSRPDRVRALVRPPVTWDDAVQKLRSACEPLGREGGLVVGLSEVGQGASGARRRIREAADAARIGGSLVAEGGAISYEQLGAYRYLVHLELDEAPRDRHSQSVEKLIEYDRRGNASLVDTLERYLADRGKIAATARALFVHPNTVRQRLDRIERVAALDLKSEDLLSLELALKLVRLHRVRVEQA